MRTVLYIDNTYCLSLTQLRDFFSEELIPGTPLYEDLLIAQRDGELAKWLAEGETEREINLSKDLCDLPTNIPNSELIIRVKHILVGSSIEVKKPHFSSYLELQQIRCIANDSEIEFISQPEKYKTVPYAYNLYSQDNSLRIYEGFVKKETDKECWVKLFLDFKVTKADDEAFEIYLHEKHMLFLKHKSVGEIVTIEITPFLFSGETVLDFRIEKEMIGFVILNETGWKITVRDVEIEMVHVESGTFMMGAIDQDGDAEDNERPTHEVALSSFNIGKYEVTQELWEAVMGENPSYDVFKGAKVPVVDVSWDDCDDFIRELNKLTGKNFRLPTEAEWEFAARGGKNGKGYKYAGNDNIEAVAWYDGNSGGHPHPVGQKHPNELGLYDMSGNVLEWCQDWKGDYSSNAQTNPTGPSSGYYRVFRGGNWFLGARYCRSSSRSYNGPSSCNYYLGLRLAL